MSPTSTRLAKDIKSLSDVEKLELVDSILTDLDRPDPGIDQIWAEEARKRWAAYKLGKLECVPYEQVMEKHKRK